MATITISNIPVSRPSFERIVNEINVAYIDPLHEGKALADLYNGLVGATATLSDGSPVNSYEKAVRWLLQQVNAQFP